MPLSSLVNEWSHSIKKKKASAWKVSTDDIAHSQNVILSRLLQYAVYLYGWILYDQ